MSVVHSIASTAVTAVLAVGVPSGASPAAGDPVLTPQERCAVRAALASGDARRVRVAGEVVRGEAGALALADPWILHHHGLDTSRTCRA
jgi:hypothetical protein